MKRWITPCVAALTLSGCACDATTAPDDGRAARRSPESICTDTNRVHHWPRQLEETFGLMPLTITPTTPCEDPASRYTGIAANIPGQEHYRIRHDYYWRGDTLTLHLTLWPSLHGWCWNTYTRARVAFAPVSSALLTPFRVIVTTADGSTDVLTADRPDGMEDPEYRYLHTGIPKRWVRATPMFDIPALQPCERKTIGDSLRIRLDILPPVVREGWALSEPLKVWFEVEDTTTLDYYAGNIIIGTVRDYE